MRHPLPISRHQQSAAVVGIPARNEEATVAAVAQVADSGLRQAFPLDQSVVVLAENGSTDDTVGEFRDATLITQRHVLQSSSPHAGKGTNVLALVDYALNAGADRLVLLDADLRSAEPSWIGDLARAVDTDEPALATPVYRRDRYEAGTTNHLVTPLLSGLFGTTVQQPIGGEFAFNRALLRRIQEWPRPASADLYGIDIWITANALREGVLIREVTLGDKLHTTPFENVLHLPQQVIDSLLHVAVLTASEPANPKRAPDAVPRAAISHGTGSPQPPCAVSEVLAATESYMARNQASIEAVFPSVRSLPARRRGLWIDSAIWPTILAEFIDGVAVGAFETSRDHLIALYVNRLVTFWSEIEQDTASAVDALLVHQADTARQKIQGRSCLHGVPVPANFERGLWTDLAGPPPR